MSDLGIALSILLVGSSLSFRWGSRCGQKAKVAQLASALAVVATLGCVLYVQGRLFLANWFPFSNIIVLSNWLPLTTAFLAGVVHSCADIPNWRRLVITACVLVAGWLSVAWTIIPLAEVKPMRRYLNGICLQSAPHSCSACSSVTLLEHYGIMTDEAEMAELCLTNGRGTQLLGIYRGLKLKTADSIYDVEVVQCDFECLLADDSFPILVPLKQDISEFDGAPGWGERIRNWLRNSFFRADHCVVLYGVGDDQLMAVGDPSSCIYNPLSRPLSHVRKEWLGVGFRIVPKDES